MSKKKKAPDGGPSNAYLVSFGDTMTALLAFFIVLNSLAKEQTGANLYAGTGSFVRAVNSFGFPGKLSTEHSKHAVQFEAPAPLYMVDADEDEKANTLRILDREKEEFQRLLNELDRFYEVKSMPPTRAAVVFDVFQKLEPAPRPLSTNARRMLNRVRPMLSRPGYEVQLVVWAPTPSRTAWIRAFNQAGQLHAQYVREAGLTAEQVARLKPVARPWLFSDAKRPVVSLVVIRQADGSESDAP